MTRAIVHSIHSQVPQTVAGLSRRPVRILSLDSHLDASLGGDFSVYPEELRIIAKRTGVHSALCDVSGGIPSLRGTQRRQPPRAKVMVAIPERMLARHASDIELRLPRPLRAVSPQESVASVVEFLWTTMGIEVYPSPPKNLEALVTRMGESWLLDVDVDCMREMQDECYTQIRNTAPGVLQSMPNVVRFIGASRPEIITISEARVSAIRNGASRFNEFLAALRDMGYEVEESGIYESDRDVLRGIRVCWEFYRRVSRRLMSEHMEAMMAGNLADFEKAEETAARDFFRDRGYPS